MAGHWWRASDCRLADLVAATCAPGPEPLLAAELIAGVPVCDGNTIRRRMDPPRAIPARALPSCEQALTRGAP